MMKKCIECKSEIHEDAKKCIKCDGFQDWRRHFSSGSIVLSLGIAFISIIALSAEKIETIITGRNSNLSIAGIDVSDGKITLVALNDGGQAAAILRSELEVIDPRAGINRITFVPESNNNLVEARNARQILLVPRSDINQYHSDWLDEAIGKGWRDVDINTEQGAKCTLTIKTTTKAGMKAIAEDATNPQVMSSIPFGYHRAHSKSFYYEVPCGPLFDIPMPIDAATIEVTEVGPDDS